MNGKTILHLLRNEILLELRQKYALGGVLIYVTSTILVCYLSFTRIVHVPTWNALFWIILLFAATNALYRSFHQDTQGKQLYLYTLVSPESLLIARMLYNMILMLILSFLSLVTYATFIGFDVLTDANTGMFITGMLLGAIGFAATFTMISAIASKTGQNSGLMAILGFPVILPALLSLMKVTRFALDGLEWSSGSGSLLILGSINVLVIALSYILFPYLWRD